MIVRTAHMADGNEFEVSSYDIPGCFERGYVYGAIRNGDVYVLNVANILYLGPCKKAEWLKEAER